jgi:hypothetical protein
MPALAGLTKRMEAMRPGDRYLAGLWEKTLLSDLLWFVWPRPVPRRQDNPHFPSWSWPSISCQVMWPDCVDSLLTSVQVQEVRLVASGPSHLGEVSEATITIKAPLIDASMLLSERRSAPADRKHNNVTMVEQLHLHGYKADCLPDNSSAAPSGPEPSGFVVPIGVSATNHVFFAIHVQLRPGSVFYERVGYVEISYPSVARRFGARHNRDYAESRDQIDRDTGRVKDPLDGLPASTIVLI